MNRMVVLIFPIHTLTLYILKHKYKTLGVYISRLSEGLN